MPERSDYQGVAAPAGREPARSAGAILRASTRVCRGVVAGLRARSGVFLAVAAGVLALELLLPPAVLSAARRPVDYFTFNPWLPSCRDFCLRAMSPGNGRSSCCRTSRCSGSARTVRSAARTGDSRSRSAICCASCSCRCFSRRISRSLPTLGADGRRPQESGTWPAGRRARGPRERARLFDRWLHSGGLRGSGDTGRGPRICRSFQRDPRRAGGTFASGDRLRAHRSCARRGLPGLAGRQELERRALNQRLCRRIA